MTKITNYENDNPIDLEDKVIGTEKSSGKTKNYKIQDIVSLVNGVAGKDYIQYKFSPSDYGSVGSFTSNSSNTNPSLVTKLFFNKKSVSKEDLTALFTKLDTLQNIVIELRNPSDSNNFTTFKITNITNHTEYFEFDVVVYKSFFSGILTAGITYSAYFDIKENFDDKLNQGNYVGTAETLKTDIETRVVKVAGSSLVPDAEITKLSHLDNTKDINKPVSTLQETRIQEVVNNQITNSTTLSNPNIAIPAEITGNAHILGVGSGTYPNWGGMVIPENNIGTLQRVAGVYSVSLTAIDLSGKVNVSDVINTLVSAETAKPLSAAQGKALNEKIAKGIVAWTAIAFASGDQVNYLGKDWVSNAAIVAGDVPGTSSKWVERLSAYTKTANTNKIYFNPTWIEGSYISGNGIYANAAYRYCDYFQILPSVLYNVNSNHNISFYTIDKVFISGTSLSGITSITTPESSYYARLSTSLVPSTIYFYDAANIYSNTASKTDKKELENSIVKNTANITILSNKINLTETIQGYYTVAGLFQADVNYVAEKEFKPCKNMLSIAFTRVLAFAGTERIVFYDSNKTLLSVTGLANLVTVPAKAYYFRYSYYLTNLAPTVTEINNLKEYVNFGQLNQLLECNLVAFDLHRQGSGKYQSNGTIAAAAGWEVVKYTITDINLRELYLTTVNNGAAVSLYFYNASNASISSITTDEGLVENLQIDLPDNTAWIGLSCYGNYPVLSYKKYGAVTKELNMQLNPTTYKRHSLKVYNEKEYYCKVDFKIGIDIESETSEYNLLTFGDVVVNLVTATATNAYPSPIINSGIKTSIYGEVTLLKWKPEIQDVFSIRKLGALTGESGVTSDFLNYTAVIDSTSFKIMNGVTEVANLAFALYPTTTDVVNYINTTLNTTFIAKIYNSGSVLMSSLSKKTVTLAGYFTTELGAPILDAGEIFFEANGVDTVHSLEVYVTKLSTGYSRIHVTIDGNKVQTYNTRLLFQKFGDLIIGGASDVALAPVYVKNIIFSNNVPKLKKSLVYMMHSLLESAEGTILDITTTTQRFARTVKDLYDNGYVFPNGVDLEHYIKGTKPAPEKAAYFIFDDTIYDYETMVNVYKMLASYNIKPMTAIILNNICTVDNAGVMSQTSLQIVKSDFLKRLKLEGHSIISHSYSHLYFSKSSYNDMIAELSKCDKARDLGLKTNVMIWPGGRCNDYTARIVKNNGYSISFSATDNTGGAHYQSTPTIGTHNLRRAGIEDKKVPVYSNMLALIKADILRD